MPTTVIAATTKPGKYSTSGAAMTMAAADVANGNHIATSKDIILVAHNTHASTTYNVTVTSSADPIYGRTGNAAAAVPAGDVQLFTLTAAGWTDSNDQYLVSADNAAIEFGYLEY